MLLGRNQHDLADNGMYFENPMLLAHNQHALIPHNIFSTEKLVYVFFHKNGGWGLHLSDIMG